MSLALTSTHLSYVARSTHLLNISSYSLPSTDSKVVDQSKVHYKSSVEVDGYDWEIRLYPVCSPHYQVELQLVFVGEAGANKVTAALSCRLVDPSGRFEPSEEKTSDTTSFQHPSDSSQPFVVVSIFEAIDLPYFDDKSLTVECTVTVFRSDPEAIPVPSSSLHQHLGELLASQAGADVMFTVSGESFPAHKNVLAARSPVFMAEFFGEMQEKSSGHVEINEMEASVFEAMLRFIYTDAVPELDGKPPEAATATATTSLAQHLLVAADRYGLDRLRVMCERRLAFAVDASSVAATLAIAERHGCSRLKAKCVEFIAGGSREYLHAILKTDGFKDLEVNHPVLLTELLVAAHGRKKD